MKRAERSPRKHGRRGQVLILMALFMGGSSAAAGCWFLTGQGASSIDAALKRCVEDGGRRKSARDVVEAWDEHSAQYLERTQKRREALSKLLERHDTRREDVDAAFAQADADTDHAVQQVLDHRFELRGHLTREEWSAVFPAPE